MASGDTIGGGTLTVTASGAWSATHINAQGTPFTGRMPGYFAVDAHSNLCAMVVPVPARRPRTPPTTAAPPSSLRSASFWTSSARATGPAARTTTGIPRPNPPPPPAVAKGTVVFGATQILQAIQEEREDAAQYTLKMNLTLQKHHR